MTPTVDNSRLSITVRQAVGWLVLFAALLGSWYDNRTQQQLTRQAFGLHVEEERRERDHIWRAIDNVFSEHALADKAKK